MFRKVGVVVLVLLLGLLLTASAFPAAAETQDAGIPWWAWLLIIIAFLAFLGIVIWWCLSTPEESADVGVRAEHELEAPVETVAPAVELAAPAVAVGAPEIGITAPEVELEAPSLDVDLPDVDLEAPELDVDLRDVDLPDVDLKAPELDVELPEVELPTVAFEAPELDVDLPDMDLPDVDLEAPALDIDLPDADLPDVDLKAPELDVDLPDVDLEAPALDVDLPDVDLPDVDLEAPELDVDLPDVDLPTVTLDAPAVDVDLPDVDLPDVDLPTVALDAPALHAEFPTVQVEAPVHIDNLRRISGIGPKIAGILKEAGIMTFAQLAATDESRLNQILADADPNLPRLADPAPWLPQARLAAEGRWAELEALQTGREVTLEDDLKIVEGIGPKIESVLHAAGIRTFAELAATAADRIEEILAAESTRLASLADPTTWPEQAQLAAEGRWAALEKLQDELKGGRREDPRIE